MTLIRQTPRLTLRRLTLDDLAPLAAIHADPDVMRFIGGVRTREQTRARLTALIAAYHPLGLSKWAVVLRRTGELIGRCGPVLESIDGIREVEIGYDLAKSHWGQGLATEAAAAAIDHCFSALGQTRIISLIHPENLGSQRVAARLGLTYERDVTWRDGTFRLYAKGAPQPG